MLYAQMSNGIEKKIFFGGGVVFDVTFLTFAFVYDIQTTF